MLPLVLSSDSHVFEPPDLWQTRIDAPFRDRAPRIERIDGADQIVVEADRILSGIGLISNAGARFDAPETISAQGRFEDVHRGGYDPEQDLEGMELDGVAGEVLYPSQGLFYFKVADTLLMSAIFRAYNDWLAEFCRMDPARLKGIAMINLDDVKVVLPVSGCEMIAKVRRRAISVRVLINRLWLLWGMWASRASGSAGLAPDRFLNGVRLFPSTR